MTDDLLGGDLLGGGAPATAPASSGGDLLGDLLGGSTPTPAAQAAPQGLQAYNKNGLVITFQTRKVLINFLKRRI